ncbi:unnamed protein product [Urochloa decumbens]|uniref:Uncharacterized protein n=1 Tax=Urochloa decumbens TaxID=240449 RepID=A0ABC9DZF7_9POAL
MYAQPQQLIIMPLVLLLTTLFFAGTPSATHGDAAPGLHPVILLPGYSCSQFDARLTDDYEPPTLGCGVRKQGRGWFQLWENYTALQQTPRSCRATRTSSGWSSIDRAAGVYRNVPGRRHPRQCPSAPPAASDSTIPHESKLKARVHINRSCRISRYKRLKHLAVPCPLRNACMEKLVEALEGIGYREGANLFGAPYDFRYTPAPPGVTARSFSDFRSSLTRLIERASERNGDKPVILVTHSFAGFYATEFLNQSPLPWRRRYIKHFVQLSFGVGGTVLIMQVLASNMGSQPPPPTLLGSVLAFGNRSFASMFSLLPSPKAYGETPLVITQARNYSVENLEEFLAVVGFSDEDPSPVALYRTRALPSALNFKAPVVPMTAINGVVVPTVGKVVYWDGNFTEKPQVVIGDGDGGINLETVRALERLAGNDPDQRYFKSVLIPNTTHSGMISDDSALRTVVHEILEAGKATST